MAIDRIPGVGPTNADIASAVGAPSAATIAAAVAAPSLASITSTVQANAGSPYGGTWTYYGSTALTGASTTITGLNSKYLRFMVFRARQNGAGVSFEISLNSNTSGKHNYSAYSIAPTYADFTRAQDVNTFHLGYSASGQDISSDITIYNANGNTGAKMVDWKGQGNFNNTNNQNQGFGIFTSSSPITSVKFSFPYNFTQGTVFIMGAD